MFKEVRTRDLTFNVFETIAYEWGVVTMQDEGKVNAMTVNLFQMGHLWREDVITIYIRPQRHSYPLLNTEATFSMCIFAQDDETKKKLAFLGSASGKDHDKLAECGYTTLYEGETPYIAQAKWVFICEKLYVQDLVPESFLNHEFADKEYAADDYHRMYVARIKKVLAAQ